MTLRKKSYSGAVNDYSKQYFCFQYNDNWLVCSNKCSGKNERFNSKEEAEKRVKELNNK